MYLKRNIDEYLKNWKADKDRKPLIIKGARQIGKTESIRNFARSNYSNFIEINFIEQPAYKTITEDGYSPEAILKVMSRLNPSLKFIPGETLIFFDEIQDFPDITTSLKFFCIDGKYDVIMSGSMLGINYNTIRSNSVGYKSDYTMYSLDFFEFLLAKGYDEKIKAEILDYMINHKPMPQSLLDTMFSCFLDYTILGGMPEVVSKYISTNTFSGTLETQRQIITDYKEDIRKYAEGTEQTRILRVFDSIPAQLAKDNKKFQLSTVEKKARFSDYVGCVEWIADAGIAIKCNMLNYPELPINGNTDSEKFKIYFADTGLFISMLDDEAADDLRQNKNFDIYKGALYENLTAEALLKIGLPICYYKKENSTLEEDFFIRDQKNLIPLEVKSANGRSKSLSQLIKSDAYPDIKYGIKLAHANIGFANNVYTFPYFCAFLLKDYIHGKK